MIPTTPKSAFDSVNEGTSILWIQPQLGTRRNVTMKADMIFSATVELIAHEFIFNSYYHTCSWKKIVFVISSFMLGAGIMALLGESMS